jgi:predicted ATPase/DNA-binding SARP family transcriptional activator
LIVHDVTTSPTLRVHLLGGFTLTWDEVPLASIPNVAARSLLAYLITYRDRHHTRDLLAGTFWPDLPDTVARRRLSRALWEIQRALRPAQDVELTHPVLLTQGDTIQFNPAFPLWLDMEEFNKLVDWSPDQTTNVSVYQHIDLTVLHKAVELYRGDLLAGYYDEWLLVKRERLREMFLIALERLVMGYKSRGEYEQALVHARRLTVEDPWREDAHCEVMRLCHLLGRDTEALKQFEICRQILAEELGVEPSPEMESLVVEITDRSDLPRPPLLPLAARPAVSSLLERPDRLPLVGRQPELAELLRQVETAAQGNGGLTLIYGEAGVGKTRLVQELAHNAQWRGIQTVWGRCYELDTPPAYQPLVEALRAGLPALHEATLEPLWRAELSRLLPELIAGETLPPHLPPEEERRRLLEAIARGFLALAGAGPHLVLLEDVHWMDPASLEALRYLLPRLADALLRVVLTARSEELDDRQAGALAALEGTRLPRRLDLERLDLAGTGELVQHALDLERPAPRFSARLHGETEGNPFYVLETLRALADEGLLRRNADGGWSTPWDGVTEDYAELPLPAGVVQTIERRLDRLPVALGELLGLAAVIGRGVAFELWFQASNQDAEELLAAGDELCARGLLLAAEPDYVFAHDQIRRVTYERLAAPRRRLYHRQVAQAQTRLTPDEPEALAYHWTQAEVWDQAADCHRQAGDRARAVYANADAITHYSQALAALERLTEPPDPAQVFELRLAREAVYGLQGEREVQANELAALEALAKTLGDKGRQAEVALRQANYKWAISDYPATIVAARAAIDLAQTQRAVELEAAGYLHWGQALWSQGNYEAAETQLGQALALARGAKLSQVEADALRKRGLAYWHQGNNAQAKACFEQALQIHREIGDRRGESEALNNLGLASMHSGDYVEANTHLEQALHIHREIGDWWGESVALNYLGLAATHLGNHAKARGYLRQSLHMGHKTGDRQVERKALTNLGKVSVTCGQYAEAKACCQQVLHICREIGDQEGEGWGLVILSLTSHHLGDYKATQEYSQQALRIAQDLGAGHVQGGALTLLGHALVGLGQLTEAANAYRQALTLQRELGQHNEAMESLAGLAHVALHRENTAQAYDHIEELLKHLETNTLHGAEEPFLVYLICCRVLQALQDPRASDILKNAHNLLQEEAAEIGDEELRRSFLENVPVHREIVAAYRDLKALQPERRMQVRLPHVAAPLGRPLHDDEYTTVTWTVDAPGDQDIPRKTDRRRHRILRLLAQAQAQGATPTHTHLAQALGVSRRTIERDVAALRQKRPHLPPTRGKMSE